MSTAANQTDFSALSEYLATREGASLSPAAVAYFASLDAVADVTPGVAASILNELHDQRTTLKLIASENYSSLSTQLAHGNLLTDKYSEGVAGHRFYAGCGNVDDIEAEASRLACELFGADHAYVQPHSGADANLVAFLAILYKQVQKPLLEEVGETNPSNLSREQWDKIRSACTNQRLLALDYFSGGHLTHGYRHNISSILFDVYSYSVSRETGVIDLDALREQVREVKPAILLAGYSAYPRKINFAAMREMADEVGATFMVDMAHFAGLVAGKVFTGDYDPIRHAHVVTSTTHKTLRGPRGGIVLCTKEYAEYVDKGCPFILGGPLPHVMAAKAVAFKQALSPDFKSYAESVVSNCQALAEELKAAGLEVLTGGTDNHLLLVNVFTKYGLTGRQAESVLRSCNVTLNRNSLPFDKNGAWYTSGLRIGTPAVTTRGLSRESMKEIAQVITLVLENTKPTVTDGKASLAKYDLPEEVAVQAKKRVADLLADYPLYPEIDQKIADEARDRWSGAGSVQGQ